MLRERIEEVLERDIRPSLRMHGGDIRMVDILEGGVVTVRLQGQCARCPSFQSTMDDLVREKLLEVDGVTQVMLDASVSDELIEMAKSLMRH